MNACIYAVSIGLASLWVLHAGGAGAVSPSYVMCVNQTKTATRVRDYRGSAYVAATDGQTESSS